MSSEETATSEIAEPLSPDEPSASSTEAGGNDPENPWRSENTRLRQELKKREDLIREVQPYFQLGVALKTAKGGEKIVSILEKNGSLENLTEAQQQKVEQAADKLGMSLEEVEQMFDRKLQESRQQSRVEREAEKQAEKLYAKAAKEFPGFENLVGTPEYNERIGLVLEGIEKGRIEIPDNEPSPHYYAVKYVWNWLKAENPDLGKVKPAGKSDSERRAAISQASVQSGGVTPEDQDKVPAWARPGGAAKAATGGRSFSSLPRK